MGVVKETHTFKYQKCFPLTLSKIKVIVNNRWDNMGAAGGGYLCISVFI